MFGQPFLGMITIFAGNFPPVGWAFCHGQLLSIAENDALFALIGTTYGGDGQTTFALPNLQSRFSMHMGTQAGITYVIGEVAGTEAITITTGQMPTHTHGVASITGGPAASNVAGNQSTPVNNVPAISATNLYHPSADGLGMAPGVTTGNTAPAGGSQPIEIMPPYLAMNYIISLFGIFPSQS